MIVKQESGRSVEETASSTPSNAITTTTTTTTVTRATTSSQYPFYSIGIEGCVYRGEGNANLVVALPLERKVIRLRKSSSNTSSSLKEEELQIRREVEFIRHVISGYLGVYVCIPEILRCDYTEIARLSDKIRPLRPEHRRSKDIVGVYATKFPDYAFLANELADYQPSKATFCIEIKPKQAHLCQADRLFQKCPYCLTQYYKTYTGGIKQPSDYCPFDLFSGDVERMERALDALLRSPQNNLKIFKNGLTIYDDNVVSGNTSSLERVLGEELQLRSSALLSLLRLALTRPFDVVVATDRSTERARDDDAAEERAATVPKRLSVDLVERARTLLDSTNQVCDVSSEESSSLPLGSALERILRMQRLHQRGADVVTWLYANVGAFLDDATLYGEPGNGEIDGDCAIQDGASLGSNQVLRCSTLGQSCEVLRNYLLFCTAKDCSVLIAFQRIDEESRVDENLINRIDVSKDESFLVSVRILDLDMKKLQCIEKHLRRDEDVLKATIKQLEKQLSL